MKQASKWEPKGIDKVGNCYLCLREMKVKNIKVLRSKQAKGNQKR